MKKVLVVALLLCAVAVGMPARPAAADLDPPAGQLVCDPENPGHASNGANEDIYTMGSPEQDALQQQLFIPSHEFRCPGTVGRIHSSAAPEAVAIDGLQKRLVPNMSGVPMFFIGVNQPLEASDWALAVTSSNKIGSNQTVVLTLPVMMDGFVVTANIQCAGASTNTLRLKPTTLAAIYAGVITRWGDPLLVNNGNSWLNGCGQPIVVSAQDGPAWANYVLKDYMSYGNPVFNVFKRREQLASWPGTLDVKCHGTADADMVACASVSGSISYMRYSTAHANGLSFAQMTNRSTDTSTSPTPPTPPGPALDPVNDTTPTGCRSSIPTSAQTPGPVISPIDWSTYSMTYGQSGYALCGFSYFVGLLGTTASSYALSNYYDHVRLMWSDTNQASLTNYGYEPIPMGLRNPIRNSLIFQQH